MAIFTFWIGAFSLVAVTAVTHVVTATITAGAECVKGIAFDEASEAWIEFFIDVADEGTCFVVLIFNEAEDGDANEGALKNWLLGLETRFGDNHNAAILVVFEIGDSGFDFCVEGVGWSGVGFGRGGVFLKGSRCCACRVVLRWRISCSSEDFCVEGVRCEALGFFFVG